MACTSQCTSRHHCPVFWDGQSFLEDPITRTINNQIVILSLSSSKGLTCTPTLKSRLYLRRNKSVSNQPVILSLHPLCFSFVAHIGSLVFNFRVGGDLFYFKVLFYSFILSFRRRCRRRLRSEVASGLFLM